jgi:hypothetical protein
MYDANVFITSHSHARLASFAVEFGWAHIELGNVPKIPIGQTLMFLTMYEVSPSVLVYTIRTRVLLFDRMVHGLDDDECDVDRCSSYAITQIRRARVNQTNAALKDLQFYRLGYPQHDVASSFGASIPVHSIHSHSKTTNPRNAPINMLIRMYPL